MTAVYLERYAFYQSLMDKQHVPCGLFVLLYWNNSCHNVTYFPRVLAHVDVDFSVY